jgi:hypothetical protein
MILEHGAMAKQLPVNLEPVREAFVKERRGFAGKKVRA